jgi:hypothetical protein
MGSEAGSQGKGGGVVAELAGGPIFVAAALGVGGTVPRREDFWVPAAVWAQ